MLSRRMTMVAMFVLLHANPLKEDLVKRSFDKFTHLGEDAIKSLMSLQGDNLDRKIMNEITHPPLSHGFSASEISNSSQMNETHFPFSHYFHYMTSKADDDANPVKETLMASKGGDGLSASEIRNSSPMKETSLTSRLHDIGSTKETLMASKADDAFSASDIRNANRVKETLMTSKAVDAFSASDIRNARASRPNKPSQDLKPYLMQREVQVEHNLEEKWRIVEKQGQDMKEFFEGASRPLDLRAVDRRLGDGSDLRDQGSPEQEEPRHPSTTGRTDGRTMDENMITSKADDAYSASDIRAA